MAITVPLKQKYQTRNQVKSVARKKAGNGASLRKQRVRQRPMPQNWKG